MRIFLLLAVYCTLVPIFAALAMRYDTSRQRIEAKLLNVSFDPTRELWRDINQHFIEDYEKETGKRLAIAQSHGGSASQARAVIVGLPGDVVTLALWNDVEELRVRGRIADHWEDRLPNHSVPYFSTIVFVVRRGNPKHIVDWPDLVRTDVRVITPNPLTSGNGKLSFLAAWGSVKVRGGSDDEALAFVTKLYHNAPTRDTSSRGAATTFAKNGQGDVHLTWENEARLEIAESQGELEILYPPSGSIRAEPPVSVVDSVVDNRGTRKQAEAYLEYLFRPESQEIIATHHFRPVAEEVLERHRGQFPDIPLFEITTVAKNWNEAQARFFSNNGVYSQIEAQRNANP
ncbi:MAG: sulfate ABC transporter substrate-binding protein [Gemmataceae bacterium]